MELHECMLINNDCYKAGAKLKPKGVMVHSTGAPNPDLKRYVQPVPEQEEYGYLMTLLGPNRYGNHWNQPMDEGDRKCVHAFIGKLPDGSIATVQTLPWEMQAWHCWHGKKGSGNTTHLSFEICEDGLTDPVYFGKVYREAVELTAYLCGQYDLDPLADGVVICHKEGWRRGVASNHADVEHWFPRHGYSMDGFRQDVADVMTEIKPIQTEKGDEDMTGEEIYQKLQEYLRGKPAPDWAQDELQEAVDMGLTDGTNPMLPVPRYQAAIMAKRAAEKRR